MLRCRLHCTFHTSSRCFLLASSRWSRTPCHIYSACACKLVHARSACHKIRMHGGRGFPLLQQSSSWGSYLGFSDACPDRNSRHSLGKRRRLVKGQSNYDGKKWTPQYWLRMDLDHYQTLQAWIRKGKKETQKSREKSCSCVFHLLHARWIER